MDEAKIYAIAEPAGPIRYVGHTTQSIEQRIKLHIAAKSHVGLWMKENEYISLQLEACPRDEARKRERFWTVHCRQAGHPLFNRNGFSPNYSPAPTPAPAKPMLPEFRALVDRGYALRITERELADMADMSAPTWWRAKNGITGEAGRTRIIVKIERILDHLEREKNATPCSLCGERVAKPCDQFGCPIVKDEA